MKEKEIRDILSNINDYNLRNYRWDLLLNDYERDGYERIFHIVKYDFELFIDKMNRVANLEMGDDWSDLFIQDRKKCEDRVKVSISVMKNSISISDFDILGSHIGMQEHAINQLFYIFINSIDRLATNSVLTYSAQKRTI